MTNLKTYKIKVHLGSLPDDTGWWTEEDWKRHEECVKELEASGDLGKEVEVEVSLVPNPKFDDNIDKPVGTWKMEFLDFTIIWICLKLLLLGKGMNIDLYQ